MHLSEIESWVLIYALSWAGYKWHPTLPLIAMVHSTKHSNFLEKDLENNNRLI